MKQLSKLCVKASCQRLSLDVYRLFYFKKKNIVQSVYLSNCIYIWDL